MYTDGYVYLRTLVYYYYVEQSKSFELSSDNESYTCSVSHVILCSKCDAQSLQNV